MSPNMFRLLIRPQIIARMQVIGYLERQATHRRLFSTDSEPEQDTDGKEGSTIKARLWDRVFKDDKRPNDPKREFKDHEITISKTISNLSTRVETGFAEVKTNFAEVKTNLAEVKTNFAEAKTNFAEVKTDFARLEGKMAFMQWQMGLVGSALAAFLAFAGYTIKRVVDATESKDASNGVKNKK